MPSLVRLTTLGLLLSMAACSSSPEDRAARFAARINASHSDKVEAARAEGRVLIVRFRNVSTANLDEDELTRMTLAGLCSTDDFKTMLKDGVSLRLEVPQAWSYITINADHCNS